MLLPNAPHADRSLGETIGRYQLLGEIARGGMGIVYVAASQGPAGFSKLIALKELRPDLAGDDELLTMFLDEARMAARLTHPNIVHTHDVEEHDGRHFIAMEYLEGRSFYSVLKRFAPRGGFPQRMALSVLRDVLAALDYAHELTGLDGRPLGFVHRDVSPHNIFVTYEGHVKVIDFGIAKARDSSLETRTGVLKGRANYMAPEQLVRRSDRRSDVFSVGAILFEVLSGRRLWQGMSEIEIVAALSRGDIPSLDVPDRELAPSLLHACKRALSARPEERFATAAELRDVLDQHLWATRGAPRNREISEALLGQFEVERQRMRAFIEGALGRLHAGESGRLEVLPQPEPLEGSTGSRRGSSSYLRTPSVAGVRLGTPSTRSTVRPPTTVAQSLLLEPLPREPDWRSLLMRWRNGLVGTALGVVFVATVALVALPHAAPPVVEPLLPAAPPPVSAPPLPAAAPVVAASRSDETIILSVGVSPSSAQIYVDDQLVPSNPFIGRYPRANDIHHVRAVAPGHLAKERTVSFADNVMIDLSLNSAPSPPSRSGPPRREPPRRVEPARPPAPVVVARPPAPPPPAPSPPVEPPRAEHRADIAPRGEGEAPRRRSIDTNNPYGD